MHIRTKLLNQLENDFYQTSVGILFLLVNPIKLLKSLYPHCALAACSRGGGCPPSPGCGSPPALIRSHAPRGGGTQDHRWNSQGETIQKMTCVHLSFLCPVNHKRLGSVFLCVNDWQRFDADADPEFNHFYAVLRIHGILVRIRIRGSVPLTNGSGSCYFVSDLQDGK
jgi:hypothetical protein